MKIRMQNNLLIALFPRNSNTETRTKNANTEMRTIDIQIDLCDTIYSAGTFPCPQSAILIEEEVVPKMDSSMKQSAVASLLALR